MARHKRYVGLSLMMGEVGFRCEFLPVGQKSTQIGRDVTKKVKKKPTKKKSSKASTTRSTAGPGFDFEDRVAAWFLLRMLLGEPLPAIDGAGVSLQMQTGTLGWLIDDLLVTSALPTSEHRQLAVSCKSNVQVSGAGLPASFVETAWRQCWNAGTGPLKAAD